MRGNRAHSGSLRQVARAAHLFPVGVRAASGLVLALATCAYGQQPPAPPKPSPALRAAIRLYDAQQYLPASQRLEELLQEEPQEPRVPYYLALCYEKLNRPDDAIVQLQQARNLDPNGHMVATADFQTVLERLSKAAAQAHAQESKSTLAQAQALIAKGDPVSALSLLYDAQRLRPEDAAVRYQIGLVYLALGWHQQALAALEMAKQLDPRLSFATSEEFAQKMEQARAKAEPSPAARDPARATKLLTQAKAEYATGNVETALSHLLEARSADPTRAETYYQLGLCYFALERNEQARAALLAAQELDPGISFASKEEFREVMRKLGAPPEAAAALPLYPSAEAKPARPLDFAGALHLMRRSAGGVFNFALKPFLAVGALEVLQHSVGALNRRGLRIYLVILDSAMEMTPAQFTERAADQLPLSHGRQIITMDDSTIACASGDLPASAVETLLERAQRAFVGEPEVAALELIRSLAQRSLALRRKAALRRAAFALLPVLLLLWGALAWHRRCAREDTQLARLRARVEWMLYRARGHLPPADPAEARFQRAQQLFEEAAAATSRKQALALLREALPLAEESARQAEEHSGA